MSAVAASGCDTIDAWDAAISVMRAPARSAMNRCVAGGIALSSVPRRYHEGSERHAGGPDGVPSAAPLGGRWAAAITRRGVGVDVAGEGGREGVLVDVEVDALGAVRLGERRGAQRVGEQAARVELGELGDALALVGHPPVEVDECLGPLVAHRGVRDDGAAVGWPTNTSGPSMPRSVSATYAASVAQAAQRVRDPEAAVALTLQRPDHAVEAGRVRPRAVDEDDRRSASSVRSVSMAASCRVWSGAL
jgi:hypothetical protein